MTRNNPWKTKSTLSFTQRLRKVLFRFWWSFKHTQLDISNDGEHNGFYPVTTPPRFHVTSIRHQLTPLGTARYTRMRRTYVCRWFPVWTCVKEYVLIDIGHQGRLILRRYDPRSYTHDQVFNYLAEHHPMSLLGDTPPQPNDQVA